MASTTLLELATDQVNAWTELKSQAQEALSLATEDAAEARADYDAIVADYASLEKKVKSKREEIAAAAMPADIEAGAEALRDLLIELRGQRAELLEADAEMAAAERSMAMAEAQFNQARDKVSEWQKELAASEQRDEQHTAWKSTVDSGSLTQLAENAAALLEAAADESTDESDDESDDESEDEEEDTPDEPEDDDDAEEDDDESTETVTDEALAADLALIAQAKARIEADIPEALLTRARERGAQVTAADQALAELITAVEDAADAYWASNEGLAGNAAKLWNGFLRAEEDYKQCVLQSHTEYDQAKAMLTRITQSAELSAAEKARITDTDLVSAGKTAATAEKAYDQARAAADAKTLELELAIVQAVIADIGADPLDNAAVQAVQAELDTLNAAVATAGGDYGDTPRANLDLWEASVPDHVWANLAAYDEATALLNKISDGDPEALADAMTSAQTALVGGLASLEAGERTNTYLEALLDLLHDRLAHAAADRQQRFQGAVRGDA